MTDLKPVDISHVNKRARQQTVVDTLRDMADRADRGDIVGIVVMYVDEDSNWNHHRDIFSSDVPTMLGYLWLLLQNLGRKYLNGCREEWDGWPGDAS